MDEVITPDLASLIYRNLREYVIKERGTQITYAKGIPAPQLAKMGPKFANTPTQETDKNQAQLEDEYEPLDLALLQRAYEHRVVYIIGKEEMSVKPGTAVWRAILLKMFLFLRDYSRSKMANLKVPTERLVEIGFIKEV